MTESASKIESHELRVLCHVHTRRSLDAWITPEQIVSHARESSIDLVIVTDHGSHLGSIDCQRLRGEFGPQFPMAAEYRSTSGDMIAAFLKAPITSRDPQAIVDEAHAQDAIVILPHPFKYSRFVDSIFEQVDVIEVFNSRCSDEQNQRAHAIAEALSKPMLVGPDAHFVSELGLAVNILTVSRHVELKAATLTSSRRFMTEKTSNRSIRRSQMLKAARRGQPVKFCKNLIRWAQANTADTP